MTNEEKVRELVQKTKSEVPSKSAVYAAVMDALEWKEEQMIERIKEFFSNCPRYLYLDKDVLGNNFLNRELMLEDLLRELKGE